MHGTCNYLHDWLTLIKKPLLWLREHFIPPSLVRPYISGPNGWTSTPRAASLVVDSTVRTIEGSMSERGGQPYRDSLSSHCCHRAASWAQIISSLPLPLGWCKSVHRHIDFGKLNKKSFQACWLKSLSVELLSPKIPENMAGQWERIASSDRTVLAADESK